MKRANGTRSWTISFSLILLLFFLVAPALAGQLKVTRVVDGDTIKVRDAAGEVTNVSQGESIILSGGKEYRLVFPQLAIYLRVEAEGQS